MPASLASIRDIAKVDLREAGSITWTDAQVERAVGVALREYGEASPQRKQVDYAVPAASGRTFTPSVALGAVDYDALIEIGSIEYPLDLWPPEYLRFDRWGDKVTVHSDAKIESQTIRIRYALAHTLTLATSTVPTRDAELLALGAAGFALAQVSAGTYASLTTHENDAQRAQALAQTRIDAFRVGCRRLAAVVRVGAMYRPSEPFVGRDIVQGP